MGFPGPSRACLQRWCVVLVVLELVDQSKEVPGRESILVPSTLEETVPLIFRDLRWKVGDTAKLQGHRDTGAPPGRQIGQDGQGWQLQDSEVRARWEVGVMFLEFELIPKCLGDPDENLPALRQGRILSSSMADV